MPMSIPAEGRVDLRVVWDGRAVLRAEVRSRRPQPSTLLLGRSPAQAKLLIPRLYSLCGDAQSVATEALDLVLQSGAATAEQVAAWCERLRLENIREHLWRLGLDWPRCIGEAQQADPLRELLGSQPRFAADPAAAAEWADTTFNRLFGSRQLDWLEGCAPEALMQWLHDASTPLAALLVRLQPRLNGLGRSRLPLFAAVDLDPMVHACLPRLRSDAAFHWRPDWDGRVFEMGPLARQAGHPLIAGLLEQHIGPDSWLRVLARVLELGTALHSLAVGLPARHAVAWRSDPEEAVVGLEMVRGVLLHWVRSGAEGIRDYRIVAPTEWNFHPEGPAREGLLELQATNEGQLRELVTLQVMALDPCVEFELEIVHA